MIVLDLYVGLVWIISTLSCVTFWIVLRRMVFNPDNYDRHLPPLSVIDPPLEELGQLPTSHTTKFISFIIHFASTCLWRWSRHSVLKCRLLNTICAENNPKGYTQHIEHGESLKPRISTLLKSTQMDDVTQEWNYVYEMYIDSFCCINCMKRLYQPCRKLQ
jgi:hypothetical protein